MDYEENQRLVTGAESPEDLEEVSLRPRKFEEYIGQEKVRANLSVFIEAAKQRKEPAGPRSALRSSGTWQNDACRNYCVRNGR